MEVRRSPHRVLILAALIGAGSLACGGVKGMLPKEVYDADLTCDGEAIARTPRGKDCVTAELVCGDSVTGTTVKGASNYGDKFYSGDSFCSSLPDNYEGPERVYRLNMPANAEAEVLLDSPCEDLDLFAIRWPDQHTCPNEQHSISQCDEDDSKGDGSLMLYSDKRPRTFLLVVDGKESATGEFGLKVNCWERG
ncbi:MAG: hypothetical protein VX899_00060 [Myxococcota bacterium]|nr:hypothetical protein [Myxococcota bacterium]